MTRVTFRDVKQLYIRHQRKESWTQAEHLGITRKTRRSFSEVNSPRESPSGVHQAEAMSSAWLS